MLAQDEEDDGPAVPVKSRKSSTTAAAGGRAADGRTPTGATTAAKAKAGAAKAVEVAEAPVVETEQWVQCTKCETWRVVPDENWVDIQTAGDDEDWYCKAIIRLLPYRSWCTARALCKRWKAACDTRPLSVAMRVQDTCPGRWDLSQTARSASCIRAITLEPGASICCGALKSLQQLSTLSCLTTLRLRSMQQHSHEVADLCRSLARLPTLRALIIDSWAVTEKCGLPKGVSQFVELTQLSSLDVEIIRPVDILCISRMSKLRSLVLRLNPGARTKLHPGTATSFRQVHLLASLTSLHVLTAAKHQPRMQLSETEVGTCGSLGYGAHSGGRCVAEMGLDPSLNSSLSSLEAVASLTCWERTRPPDAHTLSRQESSTSLPMHHRPLGRCLEQVCWELSCQCGAGQVSIPHPASGGTVKD
ncbi:MAG: hypothetical protein WDW38_001617 [Sanguina aurantia]